MSSVFVFLFGFVTAWMIIFGIALANRSKSSTGASSNPEKSVSDAIDSGKCDAAISRVLKRNEQRQGRP